MNFNNADTPNICVINNMNNDRHKIKKNVGTVVSSISAHYLTKKVV
jgi:hypothetical protein